MTRFSLIVLLAAGLGACASQQRTEPPAPIITAGKAPAPASEPTGATPAAPSASEDSVEVYAYRPPASAPDAAAPPGSIPTERATPGDGGLVSENATTDPAASGEARKESAPPSRAPSTGTKPAPAPAPSQVVAHAPPPAPTRSLSPAADVLIKQAEQQRQARDYVGAAATLERALGIQPQEPYVWNQLARVRMEQGHYSQAGNLASRSNALAGDQVTLKRDNWNIIAAARRAAGDTAGAAEAEKKARGG